MSCQPELNPRSSKCEKCDLSVAWKPGLIQVPKCYMIVLIMLLRQFLIRVPGCWKVASINRRCPVENRGNFELKHVCQKLIKDLKREREGESKEEKKIRTTIAPDQLRVEIPNY